VNHYHDEERREVTSAEELERGIKSPQDLLEKIENEFPDEIRGELMFYSSKSKDLVCQEKVNEVSRLDANGNLCTATTVTHYEEERSEDELPEHHAPRQLPDLDNSNDRVNTPLFDANVRIVPVLTQEPFTKTTTYSFLDSGSSSKLFSDSGELCIN
jgi:hypothetical protein